MQFQNEQGFHRQKILQFDQNSLHKRISDIIELLHRDNNAFRKALPSEDQFKGILTHSYNCLDQLDFILMEYATNKAFYFDSKKLADSMHKIMRVIKYLYSNIRSWIQSYSLDLIKKVIEERRNFPPVNNTTQKCSLCRCYVQEITVKQIKREILGSFNIKDYFRDDQEAEKGEKEEWQIRQKDSEQYIGSVNFLTKVIQDMETSARGYEKMVEKVEKNESVNEDIALVYLQDLLMKMKEKLGERYKKKMKKILKLWQTKQYEPGSYKQHKYSIVKTVCQSYSIQKQKKNLTLQQIVMKKLKQQKAHIQAEKEQLEINIIGLKSSIESMGQRQQDHMNEISRLNQIIKLDGSEAKIQLAKRFLQQNSHSSQSIIGSSAKHLNDGKNIGNKSPSQHKKSSRFNIKRISRISQSSPFHNQNKAFNSDFTQYINSSIEGRQRQEFSQLYNKEKGKFSIDVASQWQQECCPEDQTQRSKNASEQRTRSNVRKSKNFLSKTKKTSMLMSQKSIVNRLVTNLTQIDESERQTEMLFKQRSTINNLSLNNTQQSFAKVENKPKSIEKLSLFSQKDKTDNKQLEKVNIYKSAKLAKEKSSKLGKTNIKMKQNTEHAKPNQGTLNEREQSNINKKQRRMIKNTNLTEGSEENKRWKSKTIKNILFKPQHLYFFGGVSESYAYEKSSFQVGSQTLNTEENEYFNSFLAYLKNLRGYKNSLYENILAFLKTPFDVIEKNEIEFLAMKENEVKNLILKFMVYHKKKCHSVNCQHLINLGVMIGLTQIE